MTNPPLPSRVASDAPRASPPGASLSVPQPIEPPRHVAEARIERQRELERAAVLGIGLRLSVVIVEFVAVWYWGYAALFVDAMASLFDIVASLAIVVALRMAVRPPDAGHPFGHGRYEPLAGLLLSLLIATAGVWLAIQFFTGAATAEAGGHVSRWAWIIPLGAAVTVEIASRIVRRSGERENSTALIAEAGHYRVDAMTSLVAAVGLAAASWSEDLARRIDLISAAIIAVMMVWLGLRAAWENLHQLLDRAPEDEHFAQVKSSAQQVPGVLGVHKVLIQRAGPDAHVNIDIEVDPQMPVFEAHVIAQQVRSQIQANWPLVQDVIVHVEPHEPGNG